MKALRKCGYLVMPQDDYDMLIRGPDGRLTMLDAKSPGGKITKLQQQMLDAGWPLKFAETVEEALAIVGSRFSTQGVEHETRS